MKNNSVTKVLLIAVNSKYIHSNPAVYDLKAYYDKNGAKAGIDVEIAEYTINQLIDEIISGIFVKKPQVAAFSCYLWNIEYIYKIIPELKKVLKGVQIWLGGPEVTYNAKEVLLRHKDADIVISGEGEKTFLMLCNALNDAKDSHENMENPDLSSIGGIAYRKNNKIENSGCRPVLESGDGSSGMIAENPQAALCSMDELVFAYNDLSLFKNKIIYYESSRGCPYGCSYCLSSVSRCVRLKSIDKVFAELSFFIKNNVPQVKFVDRTFNCSAIRTLEILKFLRDNDNGITNFHFEIAGDLITDEQIAVLNSLRPGLVQLEIGVQTINPDTICAIKRTMDLDKLSGNVKKIHNGLNVHIHLDLIAGLPFEDLESFRKSFDFVYSLRPEQLQLGFLKVLKGSDMYNDCVKYGIVYQERPPYEVLYTKWLSYEDIIYLKKIEQMVENYYNSRLYINTMEYFVNGNSAFGIFEYLCRYYEENDLFMCSHSRISRYEILYRCIIKWIGENLRGSAVNDAESLVRDLMVFDLYLREKLRTRPYFANEYNEFKDIQKYICLNAEIPKTAHIERFKKNILGHIVREIKIKKLSVLKQMKDNYDDWLYMVFDYEKADPLEHAAEVYEVVFE